MKSMELLVGGAFLILLNSRNIRMVSVGEAGEPENPAPPLAESRRFPLSWTSGCFRAFGFLHLTI